MSKITTTSVLPPLITQLFSPGMLLHPMPQGEEVRRGIIERYLAKALRKIRPQDKAKKRQYDKLIEMLEVIYERKKNEAEVERAARKEGKGFSSIPSTGGTMRFHRMGT